MMNYNEAAAYIGSCNGATVRLGLERISELLSHMGNPQSSLKFIHITGTNGKGSVSAMLRSILTQSGICTGCFNSPPLLRINDSISVDGNAISDDEFAEITEFVRNAAEKTSDMPSEFELETALAFEYFKRKKCGIVVLEVGMGGRLDATNVISQNVISVITGISADHTAFLGSTDAEIAFEKSGIVKKGSPIIVGGVSPDALSVIKKRADELSSQVYLTDFAALRDVQYSLGGSSFSAYGYENIKLGLLGKYQPQNALTVLQCVEVLSTLGFSIPTAAVLEGIKKTVWRGRFELMCKSPTVIADGAHNLEGIRAAADSIRLYFDTRVNLVMGILKDKNYSEMTEIISKLAATVATAAPQNPRALSAEELSCEFIRHGIESQPYDSVFDAVSAAFSAYEKNGLPIVILGSLYMYKDAADAVYKLRSR